MSKRPPRPGSRILSRPEADSFYGTVTCSANMEDIGDRERVLLDRLPRSVVPGFPERAEGEAHFAEPETVFQRPALRGKPRWHGD